MKMCEKKQKKKSIGLLLSKDRDSQIPAWSYGPLRQMWRQ